jgi:2-oxoglutarate dehydrogenase E2 component (dihydrolipoamide succinyltransferase)
MSDTMEIKVPALGESVVEATVARWLKEVGDPVQIDETIVELETEKVTLEVSAPESGILKSISAKRGATVKVGGLLGHVEVNELAAKSHQPMAHNAPLNTVVQEDALAAPAYHHSNVLDANTPQKPTFDVDHLSPAARRAALESNVNPVKVHGTGPSGQVTKSDIIDHKNPGQSYKMPAAEPFKRAVDGGGVITGAEQRVPMSRLRLKIAERLKEAQNTAAILTTFNEVDMSAIIDLRNRYKDAFEKKHGVKLGFMGLFVKAAVYALKQIPAVNAEIDGEDIVYKNHYDIGVAVSAPQGLVVPVVRGADQISLAEIEKEILVLGTKARDNKLSMKDLTGGTFTVSNGGVFGSLLSTPIINPPQSAILGMHKTQERPVAVNGRVEIRPMMYLALSYDHRIIDGREAVTFLVTIKECLEMPGRYLLDL